MNVDDYLNRFDAALTGFDERDRRCALATLRDEIEQAEQVGGDDAVERLLGDLGDPAELAASFGEALTDDLDRADRFGEAPRAGGSGHLDLWHAGGAPILPPKPFGLGRSLNLGALAAAVGLIRPDDDDERAWEAARPVGAAALVGLCGSAVIAQVFIVALTWRDLPLTVPTHWGFSGRADHEVPTPWLIGSTMTLAAALTGYAALVVIRQWRARRRAVETVVCCGLFAWATTVVVAAALLAPSAGLVVGLVGMVLTMGLLVLVPALVLRHGVRQLAQTPTSSSTSGKE